MKEQEKQEPHLLEEVSPAFLKGAGGREFLERARRRYVLRSAEAWGFLDSTGLCLRASVTGEDGTRLAPENFEGRRMGDFSPPRTCLKHALLSSVCPPEGYPGLSALRVQKTGKAAYLCDHLRPLPLHMQR